MLFRSPLALMQLHEVNRDDVSYRYNMEEQIRSELKNEIDESRHGAGQPSSIAPFPTTDTDNFDENSNHLIEVYIIPPPTHLLSQSFLLFYLIN